MVARIYGKRMPDAGNKAEKIFGSFLRALRGTVGAISSCEAALA